MKKNLLKVLSLTLIAVMAMTVIGSAATITRGTEGAATTVTVAGVGTGDEVTLLVVPAGLALDKIDLTDADTSNDIIFIDQVTANGTTASFKFTTAVEKYDLYSGYSTMDVAAGALSDLAPAGGEEGGDDPVVTAPTVETAKIVKADAFGLTGFTRIFVKLEEGQNGLWMPAHSAADSAIYYSTERVGYDGLVKTDATTIENILTELTWANVAPTADQTIAMYGDMTGEGTINILDSARVKKLINKIGAGESSDAKEYLTADATGESVINILDSAQLKKYIRALGSGESYAFPIVSK